MSERTNSPEQSGRLYYGNTYADSPSTMPAAVNGIRRSPPDRRAELLSSSDAVLRRVDRVLGEVNKTNAQDAPPPPEACPDDSHETGPEIEPALRHIGHVAIQHATLESAA